MRSPSRPEHPRPEHPRPGADPRYGWAIVAAFSVTITVSYGVLSYAFGVLLPSMQQDLGWSRTTLSGAFSLALLVAALAGLAVGPLLDRHSPRPLMSAGAAAAALLVVAWSRVHTVAGLYFTFAGIGLAMSTLLYEPVFTVVTKWFRLRRHEALAAITMVGATSSLVFSPLTQYLDAGHGWRDTLLILAAILALVVLPLHALVVRRAAPSAVPHEERSRPARGVLHSRAFWLLSGGFALGSFATSAIAVYLVSLLLHRGQSAAFAAFALGLLGIAQLPGRIVFAVAGRAVGDVGRAVAVYGLGAAALLGLAVARAPWAVIVLVLALGASNGMSTLLRPTLVADLYGRERYGTIAGVAGAASNLARAAGPIGASLVLLLPGGFTTMLWTLAALTGAGGVAAAAAVGREAGRTELAVG